MSFCYISFGPSVLKKDAPSGVLMLRLSALFSYHWHLSLSKNVSPDLRCFSLSGDSLSSEKNTFVHFCGDTERDG